MAVQARFQVFNDDKAGSCHAGATGFGIDRPFATLRARVAGSGGVTIRTGAVDLPLSEGVFPFVEVESAPAPSHEIVTVCTAAPAGEAHGELAVTREDGRWRVRGVHRGQAVDLGIEAGAVAAPQVLI
jgi:hypothetical protein